MSTDNEQFNSTALTYEDVDRQIRHARELRSEFLARGAARLSAAIGGRSQRLLGRMHGALPHDRANAPDGRRIDWFPGPAVPEVRAARCK